ncbi:unnamed protein product [Brassica oleracea var. botrytis]
MPIFTSLFLTSLSISPFTLYTPVKLSSLSSLTGLFTQHSSAVTLSSLPSLTGPFTQLSSGNRWRRRWHHRRWR